MTEKLITPRESWAKHARKHLRKKGKKVLTGIACDHQDFYTGKCGTEMVRSAPGGAVCPSCGTYRMLP